MAGVDRPRCRNNVSEATVTTCFITNVVSADIIQYKPVCAGSIIVMPGMIPLLCQVHVGLLHVIALQEACVDKVWKTSSTHPTSAI